MTEIETKDDEAVTARLQGDDGMVTMEGYVRFRIL